MFAQKKSILFIISALIGLALVTLLVGMLVVFIIQTGAGKKISQNGIYIMIGIITYLTYVAVLFPSYRPKQQHFSLPLLLGLGLLLCALGTFIDLAVIGLTPLAWVWYKEGGAVASPTAVQNIPSAPAQPATPATPVPPVQSAPTVRKRFCSECGAAVEVNSKFCCECGKSIS